MRAQAQPRALTGFSRLKPPEAQRVGLAALSICHKNWRPGFAVRGEGIFLRFAEAGLAAWAARGEVRKRGADAKR